MGKVKKKKAEEDPPKRINLYLGFLVRQKGKQKYVAKALGISAAGLGNYTNTGRNIPSDFLAKWQDKYGNNIIEEAKTFDPDNPSSVLQINKNKHMIEEGNYVSLHQVAWDEFKETRKHDRKIWADLSRNNSKLVKNNTTLAESNHLLAENIAQIVEKLLRQTGSD